MSDPANLRGDVVPLAVMWTLILLGAAFLVETPSVRVWMVVIAATTTLGVVVRSWVEARNA